MWLRDIAVIGGGYLLGSIPFAFLIAKALAGKDIRFEGEGNVGARNVMHVVGPIPGLLTLLLDAGKGAAACWLGHGWGSGEVVLYLTGFSLMLGHGFPIWLHGRGGKGLACASGFLLLIWPLSVLAMGVIFLVARAVIPNFDRAFAVAGAIFPVLTLLEGNDLPGLLFVILLLTIAGLKKVIDLPHERAIRAKSGWIEEAKRVRRAS